MDIRERDAEVAAGVSRPGDPVLSHDPGFDHAGDRAGRYTIPRIDVLVSGTFRSEQGPPLAANFTVPSARSPHRSAAASGDGQRRGQSDRAGHVYGDRLNEVDFRVAKILRFGRTRTNVGVDVYNLFNANPVLTYNAVLTAWRCRSRGRPAADAALRQDQRADRFLSGGCGDNGITRRA